MGEGKIMKNSPLFQNGRMIMKKKDGDWIISEELVSPISSFSSCEASTISNGSSSLSSSIDDDIKDDASSSSFNSNEINLYDFSDLMTELPIKRGLSKFYHGKSESFTCLARVTSVDDLAKKVVNNNAYKKRMKSCKSYGGLDNYKSYTLPKRVISKRGSMGSLLSSSPLISPRRSNPSS